MALTETSPIAAAAIQSIGADRQPVTPPPAASEPAPATAKPAAGVPGDAQTPAAAPPSAYSFELRVDPDTQRMILEARDPVTGFVIYQMPAKYVLKQFSGQGSSAGTASRGAQVNNTL